MSIDPLGFYRSYAWLADLIVPGLTNVARQPRYFSLHPSLGMLNQVKLNGEPINIDSARKATDAATHFVTLKKYTELVRLQKETALAEAQRKYLDEVAAPEKAKKENAPSKGSQ